MNWTDGVDVALDTGPRWLTRAIGWAFIAVLLVNADAATAVVMKYGTDKAL